MSQGRSKFRILYIVSTLEKKGPTNQLLYIVNNLDKSIFDPLIITLSKEGSRSMRADFDNASIKVKSLQTGRIEGLFKNYRHIKKIVEEFQPHIIQTQGVRADSYNVRFKNNYKTVTTARNIPYVDYPAKFGKFKGGLMAKRHLVYYKDLNVVACSHAIHDALKDVGISTVPIQNGVDTEKYSPRKKTEIRNEKTQIGIDDSKTVFVAVGSLIARKNLSTLVEVFNELDSKSVLIVLGDGPDKKSLMTLVKSSNIVFHGFDSDINKYLRAADCFISASVSEGLPNAALEAMSSGLPVILSNIAPHLELVRNSELEQFLFSPTDVKEIVEKIKFFKKDKDTLRNVSRNIVISRFSALAMSQKYQQVYLNLIKSNDFQV